jgi:hypothetical protein
MRMGSESDSQRSLRERVDCESSGENVLELTMPQEPMRAKNRTIQVRHDISQRSEWNEGVAADLASCKYEIR